MADIALATAARVYPITGVGNGHEQYSFEAAERINQGQCFRIDTTTGKATLANGTVVAEAAQSSAGVYNSQLYIAIDGARQAGNAVTGVKYALLDGYVLDTLAYGAPVYLSDTDGTLGTTAGTVSTLIGRVQAVPFTGTPSGADKALKVNCPPST